MGTGIALYACAIHPLRPARSLRSPPCPNRSFHRTQFAGTLLRRLRCGLRVDHRQHTALNSAQLTRSHLKRIAMKMELLAVRHPFPHVLAAGVLSCKAEADALVMLRMLQWREHTNGF